MKNLLKWIIVGFIVLMFNISVSPSVSAVASQTSVTQVQPQEHDTFVNLSEESMVLLFNAIERLPQDMLDRGNQYEIDRFMFENGIDLKFAGERTKRGFWGCVGAVSWAVGSTAVGVLKLAKVKKFVNAAGGAQKAAKALIAMAKGGFSRANINTFGHYMMNLGSEILGIKEIKDNCF